MADELQDHDEEVLGGVFVATALWLFVQSALAYLFVSSRSPRDAVWTSVLVAFHALGLALLARRQSRAVASVLLAMTVSSVAFGIGVLGLGIATLTDARPNATTSEPAVQTDEPTVDADEPIYDAKLMNHTNVVVLAKPTFHGGDAPTVGGGTSATGGEAPTVAGGTGGEAPTVAGGTGGEAPTVGNNASRGSLRDEVCEALENYDQPGIDVHQQAASIFGFEHRDTPTYSVTASRRCANAIESDESSWRLESAGITCLSTIRGHHPCIR